MQVKKITLKKEVVANISNNEMGSLWGGQYYHPNDGTYVYVPPNPYDPPTAPTPTPSNTCGSAWTCNG